MATQQSQSQPGSSKQFSDLPTEIRLKIWRTLCNYERVVCVQGLVSITSRTNTPTVLHINHESREEGLRVYKVVFQSPQNIYFNPAIDTLYFKSFPVYLVMLVLHKATIPIHQVMLRTCEVSVQSIKDLLTSFPSIRALSLTKHHHDEISRGGYDAFKEGLTSNVPNVRRSLNRLVLSWSYGNSGPFYSDDNLYERLKTSPVAFRILQLA